MKRIYRLSTKTKLLLIKTQIIPILTYPCIPLNVASITNIYYLQTVLNKALKFAYNIRYPYSPSLELLHIDAKISPINLILHEQAKNMWYKIQQGLAAEVNIFQTISNIPFHHPKSRFPSSLARSRLIV